MFAKNHIDDAPDGDIEEMFGMIEKGVTVIDMKSFVGHFHKDYSKLEEKYTK